MYLAKQVPFVNSNMRLSVNIKSKLELYFQVTKLQLLIFLMVIFSKYEKGQTDFQRSKVRKHFISILLNVLYERKQEEIGC